MQPTLKLPKDYETLPATVLANLKLSMEERVDEISEQLARVKAKTFMPMAPLPTKGFGSNDWVNRAVKTRAAYSRDVQRLQIELQSRKDTQKAEAPRLDNAFITIARRRLTDTVFNSIMNEAREEIQG